MFDIKKTNILLAMAAAGVLMAGTPVLAQDAPAADPAATSDGGRSNGRRTSCAP